MSGGHIYPDSPSTTGEKMGAVGLISGQWYLLEELLLQLPFTGNEGSSSRDLIHAAYQFDLNVFHGE